MKKFFSLLSHRLSFILLLLLAVSLLPANIKAAGDEGQQRVAVLPFTLNAPAQMDYLVAGIRSMLGSRLAAGGGVLLVEPAEVDRAMSAGGQGDYLALARRLEADYLVSGSLTAMGGGASLDAMVIAGQGGPPQRFFATAARESEIIPAVDQLARDIGAKVLGQRVAATQAAPAPGAVAPALPRIEQPAYTTAHPDRLQFGGRPGAGSPFIRPLGVAAAAGFTKSQNLSIGLRAMDAGDVDGDGQQEIVLAGANRVHIYRRDQNRLIPVGEASTLTRYVIHHVSVADVNRNGRAEIYVSAADTSTPRSLALEWDGKEFAPLFKDAAWYVRAVHLPGEGAVLAGQQAGMSDFLTPGVFRLGLEGNGKLVKESAIDLPNKLNLFDFTFVDVDADGSEEIVMVDQDDHLVVMSRSGRRLWTSNDNYGGTTRYLGGTDLAEPGALEDRLAIGEKRHYIPARIAVRDINGDGKADIIVNKNISTMSRMLSSIRSFPSGEVHALTWDGIGMTELWRTRKIDGYIADLQLGPDMDLPQPDGESGRGAELLVGVVLKSGGLNILSSAESTVLMYPLGYGEAGAEGR